MAFRPKSTLLVLTCSAAAIAATQAGCEKRPAPQPVEASYDESTGKLRQLTIGTPKDGKPNITSYMDGSKFLRIEIDANEDGTIDRWEYYGPDQKLERVGFSRANNGNQDAWAFQALDGTVARVDIATKGDGKVNRTEFYEKGLLARAEEDTDADGRVDKWERYEAGSLASVGFDTARTGTPTTTIDYSQTAK